MYGKSACPVLRGAGAQLEYGRDIVAPSRKQAANREHKLRPVAPGDSCLLEELGRNFCHSLYAFETEEKGLAEGECGE